MTKQNPEDYYSYSSSSDSSSSSSSSSSSELDGTFGRLLRRDVDPLALTAVFRFGLVLMTDVADIVCVPSP